jgi:glycosyltransferase involved in cell wall biosynthesis
MKIVLFTRSLNVGGAERQFCELVKYLHSSGQDVTVMTYYSGGMLEKELTVLPGLKLVSLESKGAWHSLLLTVKVAHYCRKISADILYCFIGHEPAYLTKLLTKTKTVIRISNGGINFSQNNPKSKFLLHLGRFFSIWTDLIVSNSLAGQRFYESFGYNPAKMVIVHNGFDVSRFRPDADLRLQCRSEWNISDQMFLFGYVARFHPEKGHKFFLESAVGLSNASKDWKVVFAGGGSPEFKLELQNVANQLGLNEHCIWMDDSMDMPMLYNGLDACVLASPAEGFPNVIGEAMCVGIPCIATRVGEVSELLGSDEFIVEYGDATGLSAKLQYVAQSPSESLKRIGEQNRNRMLEKFSVQRCGENYLHLFNALIHGEVASKGGSITALVED